MPQFLPQQELMAVLFLHSPVLTGFPEVENETHTTTFPSPSIYINILYSDRSPPEFSFIFSVCTEHLNNQIRKEKEVINFAL